MKLAAIVLLVCLLCGCSGNGGPSNNSGGANIGENTAGTLNMYAIRENNLNPLLTSSESGRLILSLVFRPLVTVGQNFDYNCDLADTISVSDDCTVYTVRLKKDILWHDGSAFTSADLDYTVSKIMEYEDECPYYHSLNNVTDYYADGTNGFIFVLDEPDSGFPCLLNFPIVKKGALGEKINLTGTGSFVVTEHKDYSSFTLNSDTGPSLKVSLLPDNQSAFSSFKLGRIDALKLASEDASSLSVDAQKNFVSANSNKYTFLAVNHNNALLSAPSLRRIIAKLLSSDNVINDLVPGFAVKTDSFVNPSAFFATQNNADYGDIKQALEELGYIPDQSGVRVKETSAGSRRLSFDILVNSDNPSKVIAAEYIANLLGSYGFKITVTKLDFSSYIDALRSGMFDLALCETMISLNNDYTFLIGTDGSANLGGYSSENADALLSKISSSADKTAKVELLKELQSLFYTDMPHIPLWFSTSKIVVNQKIENDISIGGLTDEFFTISSWLTE